MSLAALDAALYAALSATQWITASGPTTARPFALVGRYAGGLSVDGIRETCAQYPAALLRYDGGGSTRTVDAVEGVDDTGTEAWTVLVAVEEPREIDDAIAATDAQVPGALALIDAVLLALNGLVFDEAWRDRRVRVVGYAPALIARGTVYVYAVRFEARRELPQAPMTVAQAGNGQGLTSITAETDLVGPGTPAPDASVAIAIDFLT